MVGCTRVRAGMCKDVSTDMRKGMCTGMCVNGHVVFWGRHVHAHEPRNTDRSAKDMHAAIAMGHNHIGHNYIGHNYRP